MEQYKTEKSFVDAEADRIKVDQFGFTKKFLPHEFLVLLSAFGTYMIDQAKKDRLTLQECKDKVAQSRLYNDWDSLSLGFTSYDGRQFVENRLEEAAEMYANQFIPVTPDREVLQNAITLLMSHADGDFVSKTESLEAGTDLHNLMVGSPVPPVEKWISVKDRLPSESGQVLGIMNDTQDQYICFYKPWQKLFLVYGAGVDPISDMKVTHWMPLPAVPVELNSNP